MVKNLLQCGRPRFSPWVRKIPWGRAWQPTSVSLPGESYGQSSLVSYSPWGCRELDTTERLTFSLSKKYWESYWVSCPGIVQRMWSSQGPWNRIVLYTALDSLEKGKLCPNLSQLDMEGKVGTLWLCFPASVTATPSNCSPHLYSWPPTVYSQYSCQSRF